MKKILLPKSPNITSEEMKGNLKRLYIWAKVKDVGVNKVLIDGGAAINLMPSKLLKKIGKSVMTRVQSMFLVSFYLSFYAILESNHVVFMHIHAFVES